MILSATGHRPDKLGGYGEAAQGRLVALARTALLELRPSMVITGMALGWDTAVAMACHRLAIPYVAAIPFQGQEKAWPIESQHKFHELVDDAMSATVVCDGGYAPWKMQVRNEWMVDSSDQVLALWNGTKGGTANCVAYAEKKSKPIINLWERYEELANCN